MCLKPFPSFLSQVRAVDEMNYDFQALALESRGMGEVKCWSSSHHKQMSVSFTFLRTYHDASAFTCPKGSLANEHIYLASKI